MRVQALIDQSLESLVMFILMSAMGSLVALFLALIWLHIGPAVEFLSLFYSCSLIVALCLLLAMGRWKGVRLWLMGGAMALCLLCHYLGWPVYFLPAALLAPWPVRRTD